MWPNISNGLKKTCMWIFAVVNCAHEILWAKHELYQNQSVRSGQFNISKKMRWKDYSHDVTMEITGSEGAERSTHQGDDAVAPFLNMLLLPISHNYSHFPPMSQLFSPLGKQKHALMMAAIAIATDTGRYRSLFVSVTINGAVSCPVQVKR